MAKSWMDQYQKQEREKLDWVRFHRMSDLPRAEQLCLELKEYGTLHNDATLIGACHYYIAQISSA